MPWVNSVMTFSSPFIQELSDRGFLYQCTDITGLDALTSKEKITLYLGYDATAPSLHVGNLMTIMMLRIAQRHGHRPLVLMGGATTKVADPSGKDKTRPPLNEQQIQQNIQTIQGVYNHYLNFGPQQAQMVNNDDWLSPLKYMEFLSTYGSYFTINRMITFESVKLRLEREQPLTFLEFNYMILQAYDFLELYKTHDCVLQMGGADQWGNILNGVELIRKVLQKPSYGFTCPLITTASGAKMGKSAGGAIWLNAASLSPFDFWQYWRNTEDADVVKFLKLFTDLSVSHIDTLAQDASHTINDLKILLANEVTTLAHGPDAVEEIQKTISSMHSQEGPAYEILGHDDQGNALLKTGLPVVTLSAANMKEGLPAFLLLQEAGLAASRGGSRRLIRGGGLKLNHHKVEDENQMVTLQDFGPDRVLQVSLGKKRHVLLQITLS